MTKQNFDEQTELSVWFTHSIWTGMNGVEWKDLMSTTNQLFKTVKNSQSKFFLSLFLSLCVQYMRFLIEIYGF